MCYSRRILSTSSPASKSQTLCAAQLAQKLQHGLVGPQADALLQGLAQLLAEQALTAAWPKPEGSTWVPLAQKTLLAWLSSEAALAQLEGWVEDIFNRWNGDSRNLEALLSENIKQCLLSLSERPFSPNPALLKSLLGSPPVRELIHKGLARALEDFARRATAPIAPVAQVAQGVGQWAKSAARAALSKAGALGEVVGAVSSEVERQAEKRAAEFVEAALEKTLEDLVHALSHPSRAEQTAQLRRSLVETVLGWRLSQLARELANADLPGAAQSLQGALAQWVASEAFSSKLCEGMGLFRKGAASWKEVLERHGLLEAWVEAAQQQTRQQLEALVQTPAFMAWLECWVEAALPG